MIEDLRRLYGRLAEREPRNPLDVDIERRVQQLVGELRRTRPDTWDADLAATKLEVNH